MFALWSSEAIHSAITAAGVERPSAMFSATTVKAIPRSARRSAGVGVHQTASGTWWVQLFRHP